MIAGMAGDDEDILELGGRRVAAGPPQVPAPAPCDAATKFLSIWFRCCHVYGRLYRNAMHTAYDGRCPRCGTSVQARVGPDGTPRRMFEAR